MWRRIEIENFRAFERFELDGLGRVNLLVGENNSGKTSVLEAIDLLASRSDPLMTAQLLTARSLDADSVAQLFGQIALQDDESIVIEALRTIEPRIERVALVSWPPTGDRGGLAVRLAGVPRRVPIGSLGDGIWRLLALTLCLVRAKEGVLLVDEIDAGLHYSVLSKMWKLVLETAERLDVQVFATTHSRDCYESLAAICREEPEGLSRVSIQRLERDKTRAVSFTEREIVLAAERGIEVR